jgi:ribosomal protein S18 acetylase RimI-like enzyme
MRLDITGRRPAVGQPAGLAICALRPGRDDERVYAAHEEAFSEHFLFWPTPYDEWRARTFEREALDPELWLVAWDGDEIAGQVWVLPRGDEMVVEDLSVRKPWRGRKLGLSLLEEAFRVLAERGPCLVRLLVDAQNATGALQVYLRAGMREERRFEVFEKRFG